MSENISASMFMWVVGGVMAIILTVLGVLYNDTKSDQEHILSAYNDLKDEIDYLKDEATVHIALIDETNEHRDELLRKLSEERDYHKARMERVYLMLQTLNRKLNAGLEKDIEYDTDRRNYKGKQ